MTSATNRKRRLPIGAEPCPEGTDFRVWAPDATSVAVVPATADARSFTLRPDGPGYHRGVVPGMSAGADYRLLLDGSRGPFPDPASRYQPAGPHGPSRVVDPGAFRWADAAWRGATLEGQLLYELHVGTFTSEGTWSAATRRLPDLADLGVTTIALMPVAEFAGAFGWGYDGVALFAPTRVYGEPDDFRRFVDRAHRLRLSVILDVVYNHLGPDGCYVEHFDARFLSERHVTDWGPGMNLDGERSAGVREFLRTNVIYWVREFHLDGFRFDATQDIVDDSPEHILALLARSARDAGRPRSILLVAENEPQQADLVRSPAAGGYGLDALWNDDLHHSAVVALTGRQEAYYTDYLGTPQEFVSAAKHGFLYQGQHYTWQGKRRGTPARDLSPAAFVNYLENHDQVANSERGLRLHALASPGRYRAMTAYLLLGPGTPLLFQGQEFGASTPFLYFADHRAELAAAVRGGRSEFLSQFRTMATEEIQAILPDPADPETYRRCKLRHQEKELHAGIYALHRDLIALRREEPAFRSNGRGAVDGAVLSPEAFLLRFTAESADAVDDRLLLVNLGRDLRLDPVPEPLLAPPLGHCWTLRWSSEAPRYGGRGTPPVERPGEWALPGQSAVVLRPAIEGSGPEGEPGGDLDDV